MLPCVRKNTLQASTGEETSFVTRYVPMQTLSNLRRNGCLGSIPVILLLGVGSVVAAGSACWNDVRELPSQTHELLPAEEPPPAQHSAT